MRYFHLKVEKKRFVDIKSRSNFLNMTCVIHRTLSPDCNFAYVTVVRKSKKRILWVVEGGCRRSFSSNHLGKYGHIIHQIDRNLLFESIQICPGNVDRKVMVWQAGKERCNLDMSHTRKDQGFFNLKVWTNLCQFGSWDWWNEMTGYCRSPSCVIGIQEKNGFLQSQRMGQVLKVL